MESRHASRPLLGIACRLVAAFCFSVMSLLAKLLSDRYPVGELLFFRNFIGLVPVMAWVAWQGQLSGFYVTRRISRHFLRAAVGITAMFLYLMALSRLPLADITAITFAAPLLMVVLAIFLLGEKVRLVRGSAVAIGFVGVLIILSDYVGVQGGAVRQASATGAVIGIVATCFMALAAVTVRQLTRTEAVQTIVFYFGTFASVITLMTLPFGWTLPDAVDLAALVGFGLMGGIGQIFLTQSFAYADTAVVAPFDYTSMLWAVVFGYLAFGHLPTTAVLIGAAVVICADLIIIFRERQLARARARLRQPPPVAPT